MKRFFVTALCAAPRKAVKHAYASMHSYNWTFINRDFIRFIQSELKGPEIFGPFNLRQR